MTSEAITKVLDMIQAALEDYEECYGYESFYQYDLDVIVDTLEGMDDGEFSFSAGISKIVAIPYDGNEVLKVVLRPLYNEESSEVAVYKLAKESGFGEYFAPVIGESFIHEFYADRNVFTAECYLQEKVEMNWTVDNYFKEKYDSCGPCAVPSLYGSNECYIGGSAFRNVIKVFLKKDADRFIQFLEDSDLGDFHKGNWAIVNGTLKIFDYVGGCSSGKAF